MDKILSRYNKSIIAIGNSALMNYKYDFKNEIDYLKYIRLRKSKELYNRFLDDDIYLSQNADEIKELLNKISFE
jgi:hypothetical protein